MFVDDLTYLSGGKTYRRVLLRYGKRIGGKTKLFTESNISRCSDEEIAAIEIALKNKHKLPYLHNLCNSKATNGKLYGPVITLYQIAQIFGLLKIFGNSKNALLTLWLIFARIIDQGSRLSAVRLAKIHAGCELLEINKLNEDIAYESMDWLASNKDAIERKMFDHWKKRKIGQETNSIFLYDVSSSYFEGDQNELAAFGYNRDGKKGKKIVVYGLLTDEEGDPLGIEVFKGNTLDHKTVSTQIQKLKHKYQVNNITLVGDKGMIKSNQIEELSNEEFHFITTITKPQIETLLKEKTIQLGLFDSKIVEIENSEKTLRYILRRNPIRAEEIKQNRLSKIKSVKRKIEVSNTYLKEHKRAKIEVQIKKINSYIAQVKLSEIAIIEQSTESREIKLIIDELKLEEKGKLDGCYVIKTDLPKEVATKEIIHERYKALAEVEQAFKISKTELNARPIYVRKENRTIAHLLTCMIAYKMERYLKKCWKDEDLTVMEGLETLKKISSTIVESGKIKTVHISNPDEDCKKLLDKAIIKLPHTLIYKEAEVITRKKLQKRRK